MIYALSKRRGNKTNYFCIQRDSLKCPATAIVDNQSEKIVTKSGSHMHEADGAGDGGQGNPRSSREQ